MPDARSEPLVLMVDEAQPMNRDCLDHLRYLHDHNDTNFALVLAGGQGCWDVLCREPQLRRRIWRPTNLNALGPHEVRSLQPAWRVATAPRRAELDPGDRQTARADGNIELIDWLYEALARQHTCDGRRGFVRDPWTWLPARSSRAMRFRRRTPTRS